MIRAIVVGNESFNTPDYLSGFLDCFFLNCIDRVEINPAGTSNFVEVVKNYAQSRNIPNWGFNVLLADTLLVFAHEVSPQIAKCIELAELHNLTIVIADANFGIIPLQRYHTTPSVRS